MSAYAAKQSAFQRMTEQVCGYPKGNEHEGGSRPFDDRAASSRDECTPIHASEGVISRNGGFRVLAGAEYPSSLDLCKQGPLVPWVLVEQYVLVTPAEFSDDFLTCTPSVVSEVPVKMAVSLQYAAYHHLSECKW